MKYLIFAGAIVVFLTCGCNTTNKETPKTLKVIIESAYHKKLVLQQHGFNGEQAIDIDSAVVQTGRDTFLFYVPIGEERLYTLNIAESNVTLPYINDTKGAELYYNYATHKYEVKNSAASQQLKLFYDEQAKMARILRMAKYRIDSIYKSQPTLPALKDSVAKFQHSNAVFFKRYKDFADTVHSPAAFLAVYNAIEFGDDTAGLRKFITTAGDRFKANSVVQVLVKNNIDYLEAVGNPYKVGDTLPELVLPDNLGAKFSTYSVNDKYVFINIWSTLCTECVAYNQQLALAKQQQPANKFEAISIAIDDQKDIWLSTIAKGGYTWPQLMDEKMWAGPAFKTLRFNGIPSNFFLAPGGKILAKNIKADSIMVVLRTLMK